MQSGALAIEEARKKQPKKTRGKNRWKHVDLLKKSVVSIIVVHTHLGQVLAIVATKRVTRMEIITEL